MTEKIMVNIKSYNVCLGKPIKRFILTEAKLHIEIENKYQYKVSKIHKDRKHFWVGEKDD